MPATKLLFGEQRQSKSIWICVPETWKVNGKHKASKTIRWPGSDWAHCSLLVQNDLTKYMNPYISNLATSCARCFSTVSLHSIEIPLINAETASALSYRMKRIKISMEMQSMNNRNLRWEIQRGAIWSSACQGNCILFPYLFLSP